MWRPTFRRPAAAYIALMMLLIPSLVVGAEPPAKERKDRPANHLARETSPYLLQHAHNPVDWYPWGPEAFAKAKKEGKLVFLSIGYSSCYWCHVMERESFENPDVAKLLNQWFVCIKVDREERPDIDTIYMTALQVLRQRGGWPLSMFLTADGKPIVGGTYWPPEDKRMEDGGTIRGFKGVLKLVHDLQATRMKELEQQADKLADLTQQALTRTAQGRALVEPDRALVQTAVDALRGEFDKVNGGFGAAARDFRGTKFPTPPYLELLLYESAASGAASARRAAELFEMVTLTLDRMAEGGIYDQLGGGFHRYSTERTWTVPHFEKMLYDNAQLAEVYAAAYRRTKKPLYRRVLQETMAFLAREMTAPAGGFYSALDAETAGEEGRFYVWTDKELQKALPQKDNLDLAKKIFGVADAPNFEAKYHIFTRRVPLTDAARDLKLSEDQVQKRLEEVRAMLFKARAARPQPFLDTKILTAWNGQMIAGYVAAGQALEEPKYLAAAARAADFVLKELRTKEGRLLRTYATQPGRPTGAAKLNGYLDDYAFFVHGLLALHDATKEQKWLDAAKALTDTMVKYHADEENGGFFYTSNDHEKLFARAKDQYDGAQPSGNSVAARNLVRLWVKTGDERYRALAEKTFKAFAGALKANPAGATYLAAALGTYLDARKK